MKPTGRNPTILVPGFAGGNMPFRPFREELRARGVAAECWSRSPFVYRRRIDWYAARLVEDILRMRAASGTPLAAVGWSEGGLVIAAAMRRLSRTVSDPSDVVRCVVAYGSPFDGTWAAHLGLVFDHLLRLNVREMRPGAPTLAQLVEFLHGPRRWKFHAVHGTRDLLVRAPLKSLDPAWCQYGPWDHRSLLWHRGLFDLIHKLIELP